MEEKYWFLGVYTQMFVNPIVVRIFACSKEIAAIKFDEYLDCTGVEVLPSNPRHIISLERIGNI